MFCTNCGKNIRDGSKFCPYCGSTVKASGGEAAPVTQVQAAEPVAQVNLAAPDTAARTEGFGVSGMAAGPKKRRGVGVLLAVGAAAVAVCVVAALLLGGLLGGAKVKVGKAVSKSLNAHMEMAEAMGVQTASKLAKSKEFNQSVSLKLKDVNAQTGYYGPSLNDLEGLQVSFATAVNLSKRDLSASASAAYGSASLMSASAQLKNDTATIFIPELMKDTAFSVNTVTLGKDLKRLDADEDLWEISFNLFDIAESYLKPVEMDKAAAKAFIKAIEVKKTGKESVDVNGNAVKCTAYHVVVPEDAMLDLLKAWKDCVKAQGYDDMTLDMLRSIGVPEDEIGWIEDDVKNAASGTALFDALKEGIKELGDLELDVYLDGGYVMGVVWEEKIDGSNAEVGVYLGGGKNYVDDLSVEIKVDSESIRFESTGNHAGKSGKYSDESVLRYKSSWSSYTLKSEMSYEPKKSENNFSWAIKDDNVSLSMEGQLTANKNAVRIRLDELTLKTYGTERFTLEADYAVESYDAQSISAKKTVQLSKMSESDLEDLFDDIESEAEDWARDLVDEVPELSDILRYL